MNNEDIISYFDNYVKPYLPYTSEKFYSVLIDYISNTYLSTLYNNTPLEFKQLYEQNEVISNVYDQLMVAIGVHEEVINELTVNEKFLFLKSLSDFQRYKGTVAMFQNVATTFNDKFDVAELYVDYDTDLNEWILKPLQIFKGSNVPDIDQILRYKDVYDSIPSLLIGVDQLTNLRETNNSIFPLKTNLVLLDYNLYSKASPLINVVISTILKEFGNSPTTIYMRDDWFELSFKQLFFVWYYVVNYYYDCEWSKYDIEQLLRFSETQNPYYLVDLPDVFKQYNSINNAPMGARIYKELFEEHFTTIYRSPGHSRDALKLILETINLEFSDYLHSRFAECENAQSRSREFNRILTELYNSFLWVQYQNRNIPFFSEYYDNYFLPALPNIVVDPKNTTSFIILHNFKPFHVEFVTRYRETVISDDLFDMPTPTDTHNFLVELIKLDFIDAMDDHFNFSVQTFKVDNVIFESIVVPDVFPIKSDPLIIQDGQSTNTIVPVVHVEDLVDVKLCSPQLFKVQPLNLASIVTSTSKVITTSQMQCSDSFEIVT